MWQARPDGGGATAWHGLAVSRRRHSKRSRAVEVRAAGMSQRVSLLQTRTPRQLLHTLNQSW